MEIKRTFTHSARPLLTPSVPRKTQLQDKHVYRGTIPNYKNIPVQLKSLKKSQYGPIHVEEITPLRS